MYVQQNNTEDNKANDGNTWKFSINPMRGIKTGKERTDKAASNNDRIKCNHFNTYT